ncbi:MAG: hypothetical protein LBB86_03440 [Oscillospiraceae bacterium]|jgi:pilin isopeptide linkage protein|nr:hypothetical protein [Oscillospiraceae bacterium]
MPASNKANNHSSGKSGKESQASKCGKSGKSEHQGITVKKTPDTAAADNSSVETPEVSGQPDCFECSVDSFAIASDFEQVQTALDEAANTGALATILIARDIELTDDQVITLRAGSQVKLLSLEHRTISGSGYEGGRSLPLILAEPGSEMLRVESLTLIGGNNIADDHGYGGAIESHALITIVTDVIACRNSANYGGAIGFMGRIASVGTGSRLTANVSRGDGGAVYVGSDVIRATITDGVEITGNTAEGSGGGIFIDQAHLKRLYVAAGAVFSGNASGGAPCDNCLSGDAAMYNEQIQGASWSEPHIQGYNNVDISYVPLTPAFIRLTAVKNTLGCSPAESVSNYGLFDDQGGLLATASSDSYGTIAFPSVPVDTIGDYSWTIKPLAGSPDDPQADGEGISVSVHSDTDGKGGVAASYSYPAGEAPRFVSAIQNSEIGLIVFPELTFGAPGDYKYTVKEETRDGDGWVSDKAEYPVIVHVADDGQGNYVATAEYPDGYPEFADIYTGIAAKYTLGARKTTIGAPLPGGRFEFGLYDADDTLIAAATSTEANESPTEYRDELISLARATLLERSGTVFGSVAISPAPPVLPASPSASK